ncbi:MAG: enoyl-CoA hydratase/isomerase family protein [Desulfobacteraceae bacterium]|nr:MAG: enoyl-CoA hydratase/isomerase family protein [Desulfobacteraceae bacterium]
MINKRIEDHIVIVEIANDKTNAYTLDLLRQLSEIVKEVNDNDALKGLVLTGSGRFFSSGFDLPMFLGFKDHDEVVEFFKEEEAILLDFFMCRKPVVSAINGHAAAGGLIFAMASDYRVVKNHPKIRMGMSEIKIGLPLTIAQAEIMRFGLGSDRLFRDVMFFGDMVDVTKARDLGIVDEIVEEDALVSRAKEIVSLWIDTPGRPFIPLKYAMKKAAAQAIQKGLKEEDWQSPLKRFFEKSVRDTLEFVHASMQ